MTALDVDPARPDQRFENAGATKFWRQAIPVAFEESPNPEGPVQRFVIP